MNNTLALALLNQANTGNELLAILDSLVDDSAPTFDYVESPVIESVLGVVPTLEEIAF